MRLLVQPDVEQRFWDKVEKLESGYWQWIGGKTKYGIGRFKYKGETVSAHRFAYSVSCEVILDDTWIVRKRFCLTPGCCNPEHLMVGDRSLAITNGHKRGNVIPPNNISFINSQGSKSQRIFSSERVREIRTQLSQGVSVMSLSQMYQVDRKTIYSIKNNKNYKDV